MLSQISRSKTFYKTFESRPQSKVLFKGSFGQASCNVPLYDSPLDFWSVESVNFYRFQKTMDSSTQMHSQQEIELRSTYSV